MPRETRSGRKAVPWVHKGQRRCASTVDSGPIAFYGVDLWYLTPCCNSAPRIGQRREIIRPFNAQSIDVMSNQEFNLVESNGEYA